MKKLLILLFIIGIHIACVPTIYAQSLPVTLNVVWSPNAATENVTSYEVKLDTNAPIVVSAVPNAQGVITTPIVVNSFGHHDMTVVAKGVTLACDDPTQCSTIAISSSPAAVAGFTLSNAPSKVASTKITK